MRSRSEYFHVKGTFSESIFFHFNKKTGGKVFSKRIPKGSNRLKIALRNAAIAIGNLKGTYLSSFFARIAYRKGRSAAI